MLSNSTEIHVNCVTTRETFGAGSPRTRPGARTYPIRVGTCDAMPERWKVQGTGASGVGAVGLEADGGHEGAEFRAGEDPASSGTQVTEPDRPELGAHELAHRVAGGFQQPPHDVFTSLM
jgi:hypothetical protein